VAHTVNNVLRKTKARPREPLPQIASAHTTAITRLWTTLKLKQYRAFVLKKKKKERKAKR
jgi:hypothetical protein